MSPVRTTLSSLMSLSPGEHVADRKSERRKAPQFSPARAMGMQLAKKGEPSTPSSKVAMVQPPPVTLGRWRRDRKEALPRSAIDTAEEPWRVIRLPGLDILKEVQDSNLSKRLTRRSRHDERALPAPLACARSRSSSTRGARSICRVARRSALPGPRTWQPPASDEDLRRLAR